MDTNNTTNNGDKCRVRSALKSSINHRRASLSEVEKIFLHKLLIDKPDDEEDDHHKRCIENAIKVLNDDILFSIPVMDTDGTNLGKTSVVDDDKDIDENIPLKPPKPTRSNAAQLDLWKVHGDGVRIKDFIRTMSKMNINRQSSRLLNTKDSQIGNDEEEKKKQQPRRTKSGRQLKNRPQSSSKLGDEEDAESLDVQSDEEVGSINDDSSASSWNSSQGDFTQYDTWEVLKDEYAEDFGFNVCIDDEKKVIPYNDDENERRGIFKILGTSADDHAALPHVLSPPLMDSLLNFVPNHLQQDNFWLKFSLVRDGASLDILKRYCRAATHTIIAIETTNGEVFGAFTSAPWRTNNKYFGTGESFLWRMRHNRNKDVHSLFEQAQLETEIDIFPYNNTNDYIQLCTHDTLALGGGDRLKKEDSTVHEDEPLEDTTAAFLNDSLGFGLALDENLLHGTSSPSATFGNPNLVDNSQVTGTFDVMNLEVWGFTGQMCVNSAEKSEMNAFFLRESIKSNMSSSDRDDTSRSSVFSSDDLSSTDQFYRRLGQNDDNEADRSAWQYSNMMNPVGTSYRSVGNGGRY